MVLDDVSLGELTIVRALMLMSGLARLVTVLLNAGSLGEVCCLVFFYFANLILIVYLHLRWLCRDWRRRIILGLLNLYRGFHPRWRCRDLWSCWHCRGMLK